MRERRAAARQARDNRNTSGTSVRKERAEIEGLQATLEKMKIDFDTQIKKLKTNERRLQQLVKDQTQRIEDLDTDILQHEADKAILVSFIEKLPNRLPLNVAKLLAKSSIPRNVSGGGGGTAGVLKDRSVIRRIHADDDHETYVEEVEVEALSNTDVLHTLGRVTPGYGSTGFAGSIGPVGPVVGSSSGSSGKLSSAIFASVGSNNNDRPSENHQRNNINQHQHSSSSSSPLRQPQRSPEVNLEQSSRNMRLATLQNGAPANHARGHSQLSSGDNLLFFCCEDSIVDDLFVWLKMFYLFLSIYLSIYLFILNNGQHVCRSSKSDYSSV